MAKNPKNKEIEQLEKENARLKAALSEAEFENQRLSIINNNLESQLAESNRELEENIEVLQSLKSDIENLVNNLKNSGKNL
jgi:small-conductance mechanosensitive channel